MIKPGVADLLARIGFEHYDFRSDQGIDLYRVTAGMRYRHLRRPKRPFTIGSPVRSNKRKFILQLWAGR